MMVFITLGFCSSPKSLFLEAITNANGISRGTYSINDSFRSISTAIMSIFFGALVMRFGTKKMIAFGFGCLILSCITYAFATHLFMFYAGGCLLGVGLSCTTTNIVGTVVNRWCKENKGTVMGAVLAANGLGGAVATQILSPIIYNSDDPFSYRDAYLLVAAILLVVVVVIMIFFRESPKDGSDEGIVITKKKARGATWEGIEYNKAVKTAYFYGIVFCVFVTGFALQGLISFYVVYLKDVGLPASFVASVLSVHSISLAVFKFLMGAMYDHFGLKKITAITSGMGVFVVVSLSLVTNSTSGMILAMFFGIFSSFVLPLETVMLPLYTNELFGQKSFEKILGILTAAHTVGAALGSPVSNMFFDIFGNYNVSMIMCGGLMLVVTFMIQAVIRMSEKERAAIEKK